MPKITEYNAPTTKITESNEGYSAWETAGRRIGPLLNQAAQDATKEGQLQAQSIKESAWPLRFLELAKKPTTVGFRVAGDVNANMNHWDSEKTTGGIPQKSWSDQYNTLGQVGAGAANIGDLMDEALNGGGLPNRQTIGQNAYDRAPGDLPPQDPWQNSRMARSNSPNAQAAAAASAYLYGNDPATGKQRSSDNETQYDQNGRVIPPPAPYDNGYGGAIGRIRAAIEGVTGQGGAMSSSDEQGMR